MLASEVALLLIALAIATLVGVRNAKRNFRPSLRSHVELFVVGIPVGFLFTLVALPEHQEAIFVAAACAVLAGAIVSFSLPRRWRYWEESRRLKEE
jgi:uncharacterized membrane protein AbrB (regulator of aidB expression)